MKERPILFTGLMVRAILSGAKTQTRRICKPQPLAIVGSRQRRMYRDEDFKKSWETHPGSMEGEGFDDCPYGQPGDRLWVRETARIVTRSLEHDTRRRRAVIRYEADGTETAVDWPERIKVVEPGHCMANGCFREAARIALEITGVRVERLKEISEADAIAEGVTSRQIPKPWGHDVGWCADWSVVGTPNKYGHDGKTLAASDVCHSSARHAYWNLWEKINGPGSWDANPWVWAVEFRRVRP